MELPAADGARAPLLPQRSSSSASCSYTAHSRVVAGAACVAQMAWKLGPALAAGNAVVLKPAESTPVSIMVLIVRARAPLPATAHPQS